MLCGGLNRRLKENAPKGGGFYHGPPSADLKKVWINEL
jgi:hypothetical protein